MIAMGFMNIAGSLSSCYVATGEYTMFPFLGGVKFLELNLEKK